MNDQNAITVVESAPFQELTGLTLKAVAGSSARVYAQTFRSWAMFCAGNNLGVLDFAPGYVLDFLAAQNTTKATRQRQLAAMRKLAQMLYVLRPTDENRRYYEALKIIKAPAPEQNAGERVQKALSPSEADKLLRVWEGDTNISRRNRALIAVLLLSGIRRSEAAALQWPDIDFENGVLTVRHGKGDKRRDVPLAGEYAIKALKDWQFAQASGRSYVFCSVNKGDNPGPDAPLTGTDVYRTWRATCERASVDSTKPHDARRTFITEALATGTPIQTVQAAAGHARGDTTLQYAKTVSARRARKELRLRYGD